MIIIFHRLVSKGKFYVVTDTLYIITLLQMQDLSYIIKFPYKALML